MGLTFLNPAFLFGALATAVPVLIHLINRRRALVHRFPAIRFLLMADKRTARKFRLYQWLLLALRVLAILLLALVLTRPRLTGSSVHAAAVLPPQALVIMVDNSLSMQYRDGAETRLQRATALATHLLQDLRAQDSAAILPMAPAETAQPSTPFLTHDTATLRQQLLAIRPSHAAINTAQAFQQAFTLLQEAPVIRRRVVLFADFTIHGWEEFHLSHLPVVPEHIELHFVRLGGTARDPNIVIEDIQITEKPFIEHVPLDLAITLRNRGTAAVRNLRIDLFLEHTKVGEQLVDLRPDEQTTVPMRIIAPPAGIHWGEVRLEGDPFAEDDHFYYALQTVAPVRILAVDGDPGTSLFESELFYLLSALQPAGPLGRSFFYPKPVSWEGVEQERLSDYQVVILCNVEAVTPQFRQRLQQFVMEGGGLWFFMGNRIDPIRYNALFYRSDTLLLPLALGAVVPQPSDKPLAIGTVDSTHEALAVFAGEDIVWQRVRFFRHLGVEGPAASPEVKNLLTFQDGSPLLVEKSLGRGKVMLFTSSADRDWTDFPTRTAYVPFLHGVLGSLANLAAASQRPRVIMPEPTSLPGRPGDVGATLTVQTPDGQERLGRFILDQAQVLSRFADYTIPGLYRVTSPGGNDFLAVNATRAESDFEKLQLTDIQTKFSPLPVVLEQEDTFGQDASSTLHAFTDLSGILMLALVAVLMVENVCANRL